MKRLLVVATLAILAACGGDSGGGPAATPTPIFTPTPQGAPALSDITFIDDASVGTWPETSQITSVQASPGHVCIFHTKAGQWPRIGDPQVEANPWFVVNIDGQWFAATWEFLGVGQECKNPDTNIWGAYTTRGPLKTWHPTSGELIGLFVSTQARAGVPHTSDERSNIEWIHWP